VQKVDRFFKVFFGGLHLVQLSCIEAYFLSSKN